MIPLLQRSCCTSLRSFPASVSGPVALAATALAAFAIVGCGGGGEHAAAPDSAAVRAHVDSSSKALRAAAPTPVNTVHGFSSPESVRYDSAADVFYVSNINGSAMHRDNNGFISRMPANPTDSAAAPVTIIAGGKNGVELNAPKGLALIGDTLWVADIDVVRAFNVKTGAPVATVDLRKQKAVFLNDVTAAPDGAIYITDTGIRILPGGVTHPGPGRVFRIGADRRGSVVAQGKSLEEPNGITWDKTGKRLIIVSYGSRKILSLTPGDSAPKVIGFSNSSQMDGVEILPDGRMLITSWADSSLAVREGNKVTLTKGFPTPADIGVDTRRNRVAVPLLSQNRVVLYAIPPRS